MSELDENTPCRLILIDHESNQLYQILREKFNQQRKGYLKWIQAKVNYLEQRKRQTTRIHCVGASKERFLPIEFIFDDYLVIDAMKSNMYSDLVEILPFVLNRKSLFEMAFKQWFFDPVKQSSEESRMDLDIAYMVVQCNGSELKDLSYQCRANKKIVLAAVTNYGQAYMYTCEELKNDVDVIMAAVKNTNIPLAEDLFKRYPQVAVEYLVRYTDFGFDSIPNFVFECKDIILEAISRNVNVYSNHRLSNELKRDRDVILAVASLNITLIEKMKDLEFFREKEFGLELVKNNCMGLKYLPYELRNDYDIMMICLEQDSSMLELSPKLQRDKEFLFQAIKEGFKILPYIPSDLDDLFQEFKEKRNTVTEAKVSQQDNFNLFMEFDEDETTIKENPIQKPDRKLVFQQNDRSTILQAIKEDYSLLDVAPDELRSDREFAIECIICSFYCFYYLPIFRTNECSSILDFLLHNEDILISALKVNQYDLDYYKIPRNLIQKKDFMLKAIEASPYIFLQFNSSYCLNEDKDFCMAMLRYHGYMDLSQIKTKKDFDEMLTERMNYAYGGVFKLH